LTWIGAGVPVCLDVDHVREFTGVLGHFLDIYGACNVEAAVTDVDSYARFLCLCMDG